MWFRYIFLSALLFCCAAVADETCPIGWGYMPSVIINGNNLFDITTSRIAKVGALQPDGSYRINKASAVGIWVPDNKIVFNGEENKQYTLYAYIKSDDKNANITLGFFYSDGTTSMGTPRGSFTEYTLVTALSIPGKTVVGIGVPYSSTENIYIKDLQVMKGEITPTEYDPYRLYLLPIKDNCTLCPPNTYKDFVGNAECTPCPNGTMSPSGATSIDQCGHILHIGGYVAFMPVGKRTEHGLCTMLDNIKYCADLYEKQ